MSDFEIEDDDQYISSSWNKKNGKNSKSTLFSGNNDEDDPYNFDLSSKSKYSSNKKSPTRMSHDFIPKEYNKEKNKVVSGVSKSTSAIDDTSNAMDRAASLLAKYDKGGASTTLSRTVSTKKLPSRFDEDDISIDDDEFVNEDEIDMSASYDSKTMKKQTKKQSVVVSQPAISKSIDKPITVATSKAAFTISPSSYSKPEYLGNIKGIDELEASISMEHDYVEEASQSFQQSSQKSYTSNTSEIVEDMDEDEDESNNSEVSNDISYTEPANDERETPKIVSFADFNSITGWNEPTVENDNNKNIDKDNEQSRKDSKLSDNNYESSSYSNTEPRLPSYSNTEPVPINHQNHNHHQNQQHQQQQQYQQYPQQQQQQQQQNHHQQQPYPYPQPNYYAPPPIPPNTNSSNPHQFPQYYPPMYSYPPQQPYYVPPPIQPLSSLDATSSISGMGLGYPFMSSSQQFFQRAGLGSYHQPTPLQSSNSTDPIVLDLLRELKQAKDDAAWAKNRLADMITLINKKGSNKINKADISKEIRRSKSPVIDDDYADEEYEEYSADFEGSQLNISQETIKSEKSIKFKYDDIKQRQSPLKNDDIKQTIPIQIPIQKTTTTTTSSSSSSSSSSMKENIDLGQATSISGLNLGDAYQTSRALFRHQLDFLRERMSQLSTNKPIVLPGPKASSSVPSLQELKEQFEKKRLENANKVLKMLKQNPDIDENYSKHLEALNV